MHKESQTDKEFNQFYARAFTLAAAAALAVACYKIAAPFFGPLLWAMFFAFLLHPAHLWLARRLRNRPEGSAWILCLLTLIVIVGPLAAFTAAFVGQTSELVQYVQGAVGNDTRGNLQQLANHPFLQTPLRWLQQNLGITTLQVRGWLEEAARSVVQTVASTSGQLFLGALGTAAGLCLTLFLLFFFIRDGATMLRTAQELVPLSAAKREELFTYLASVTRAVVFGTVLTALIQGAMVGIAFLIVGLPSPLVFGALAGLLSLLPVGGTAFVWGPAAVYLALQDRWFAMSFMLIWGAILVSTIDNLLRPLLISGRAPVSTLTILIGVLGGVGAFGAIGLFLGPVVLALAVALIRFALEAKREHEHKRSAS